MRHVAWFLPFLSRGLAILAVLAGIGAGYLESSFGVAFVCMDECPRRAFYFSSLGPGALRLLTPSLALAAAALAVFLAYCLATRQARRAGRVLLGVLVGGLIGAAVRAALALHAQATLPIWGGEEGDLLIERPLETWQGEWGAAITLVTFAWTGVLAYVQWHR